MPPSVVALPPIPIMKFRQPLCTASNIISPTPNEVAFHGSGLPSTSVIPDASAISITAVSSSSTPYVACTFCPIGPVTSTCSYVPFMPSTKAVTVPSPPSASGLTTTSAFGIAANMPSLQAIPACMLVMLPLNESIATTTFILPFLYFCLYVVQ